MEMKSNMNWESQNHKDFDEFMKNIGFYQR